MPARVVEIPYSCEDRHGCYYKLPTEGVLIRVFVPEPTIYVDLYHNGNPYLRATKGVFPFKVPLSMLNRSEFPDILLRGVKALPSVKVLIDDMPAMGSRYDFGTFEKLVMEVQPIMTFPVPSFYSRARSRWIEQWITFEKGWCYSRHTTDPQHYFSRASM